MLDSVALLGAMRGIREDYVLDTIKVLSYMEEQHAPRRLNRKFFSTLLVAAIIISIFTVTAYAIYWSLRGTATHRMPEAGKYTSLSELPNVERTVRYPITVPDSFSSGYIFTQLRVDGMADYDDSGNIIREYYDVNVTYTKPGAAELYLNISPIFVGLTPERTAQHEIIQIDGVDVGFRLDTYKFVPDDYQKTEEDIAAEAEGHFFVTYGPEQLYEAEVASACFDLDGARYTLIVIGADRTAFDLLGQLAKEIITAR